MSARSLYVPSIGDKLTLASPWRFTLYPEWRNMKFWEVMGLAWPQQTRQEYYSDYLTNHAVEATLPTGTVLTVDRIYIRKGAEMGKFDSLTFRLVKADNKTLNVHGRFWAKLIDVNAIEFEV